MLDNLILDTSELLNLIHLFEDYNDQYTLKENDILKLMQQLKNQINFQKINELIENRKKIFFSKMEQVFFLKMFIYSFR